MNSKCNIDQIFMILIFHCHTHTSSTGLSLFCFNPISYFISSSSSLKSSFRKIRILSMAKCRMKIMGNTSELYAFD